MGRLLRLVAALPGKPWMWVVGIVLFSLGGIYLWRGVELRATQVQLAVSQTAQDAALAVVSQQQQITRINDDVVGLVVSTVTEARQQQAKRRQEALDEYLDSIRGTPDTTPVTPVPFALDPQLRNTAYPEAVQAQRKVQESRERDRVDQLSRRMRDVFCQASPDDPTCDS